MNLVVERLVAVVILKKACIDLYTNYRPHLDNRDMTINIIS